MSYFVLFSAYISSLLDHQGIDTSGYLKKEGRRYSQSMLQHLQPSHIPVMLKFLLCHSASTIHFLKGNAFMSHLIKVRMIMILVCARVLVSGKCGNLSFG